MWFLVCSKCLRYVRLWRGCFCSWLSVSQCAWWLSTPSALTMEAGIHLETSLNMYQTTRCHISKWREDGGMDEWGVEDSDGSGRDLSEGKLWIFQEGLGKLTKKSRYPVSASTFEPCISGKRIRFAATPTCLYGGVKCLWWLLPCGSWRRIDW